MSPAEFYTYQFYAWEIRGRGWLVGNESIQLEAPFMPFFRHGHAPKYLDDGKRPSMASKIMQAFKGKLPQITIKPDALDYEEILPYLNETEPVLTSLQIIFSKDRRITAEKMKAFLTMLSYVNVPLSFELIGTETEIIVQLVCDEKYISTIEIYFRAYFPNGSLIQNETFLLEIFRDDGHVHLVDYGLSQEFVRPIKMPNNFTIDPYIGIIAVLDSLRENEQAGIQVLFQPTHNHWSASITRSVTLFNGTSFFADAPDAPLLAKQKIQSPLYGVTVRAFSQSPSEAATYTILQNLNNAILYGTQSAHNKLLPLSSETYDFETRVKDILDRTTHRLGMILNLDELLSIVHIPSETINSKKLFASTRKTKELPAIARGETFVLGENTHNNVTEEVTVGIEERLKHTHIIGSTGTGKSTLIANLILQDIDQKHGVVVFDPHGDLVDDIISHIPEERLKDVVLVDPSDIEYPIGLNLLQANSDIEKEVLSSDLVASFQKYATSWGDQMTAVLGNAILAILETKEGGSLNDLRRFLIEKEFRATFLKKVTDPSVLYYWQKEFPLLKTNSIGPILIRLDTFLRPRSIRNMVVQTKGLNFETLLNENKIVLLKLSQGLIGKENSYLLGSLILSKIHQAVFRRQQSSNRNPVFLYLDEFQNFITPSIKEMLSGVRKYNVGLILCHQDLQQMQREDSELLNSVLGNTTTRVVFRIGETDAKKLQDGFSEFTASDLQNLGRGEAVMRIEQPQYDCSLDTLPLEKVSIKQREKNTQSVITQSRTKHAASKSEIEQMLFETFAEKETVEPIRKSAPTEHPIVEDEKPEADIIPTEVPAAISSKTPVFIKQPKAEEQKQVSTHRYLQTLVKQMAEARGYTAGLEIQLPYGAEKVDVLLQKDGKTTAVEICVTTDVDWEVHNIEKCIKAKYDCVVSLSGDLKHLEKIKKKCLDIEKFETYNVLFFTPDALFTYLDQTTTPEPLPTEQVIKGYRVNVSYDPQSDSESERKRSLINQVIGNSMKRNKKK